MTKVYDGVTVLTYDEWQKKPEVKGLYEESDECDVCEGSGEHTCECGNTHECEECDGSGKEINLREMYEKVLRDEIKRLRAWQEGKAIRNPSNWLTPLAHGQRGSLAIIALDIPGSPTVKAAGDKPALCQ